MRHGALFRRQFGQRRGKFLAENFFIRIARRRERRNDFGGEIFLRPLARAAPRAIKSIAALCASRMRKARSSRTPAQQIRFAGELDENFLKQIARVGLVAGEVQEKGIKRLRVLVVEPFDVQAGGHVHNDAPARGNLSMATHHHFDRREDGASRLSMNLNVLPRVPPAEPF